MKALSTVSNVTAEITPAELLFQNYLNQQPRYSEFAQSRTNFQIEKFIATADNTPVNCYVNTLHQTRVMNGELLREVIEATTLMREFALKWDNADKTQPLEHNGRHSWYDLDSIAHQHRVMEISINIKDKLQQLEYFYNILDRMIELHGSEFTRDEYETEAPEYWAARFRKQVLSCILTAKTGVDSGNSEAILNATANPILPDSKNLPIDFPGEIFGGLINGNQDDLNKILNYLQVNTALAIENITQNPKMLKTPTEDSEQTFESLGVVKK